jgi:hypothetical protein
MAKKEKLIKRIKTKPKNFTYDEVEYLLLSLGVKKAKPGKTGGSRVRFAFLHFIKRLRVAPNYG